MVRDIDNVAQDARFRYASNGDEGRLYDVLEYRLPVQYNQRGFYGGNQFSINSGVSYLGFMRMVARFHIAPADKVLINNYDTRGTFPDSDTLWYLYGGVVDNSLFVQLRDDLELAGGHRPYVLETRVYILSRVSETLGSHETGVTGAARTRTGTHVDHLPIADAHGVNRDFGIFRQDALQAAVRDILQSLRAVVVSYCSEGATSIRADNPDYGHWPGELTTDSTTNTVEYSACQSVNHGYTHWPSQRERDDG